MSLCNGDYIETVESIRGCSLISVRNNLITILIKISLLSIDLHGGRLIHDVK